MATKKVQKNKAPKKEIKNSASLKNADTTLISSPRITEKAAIGGQYSVYVINVSTRATKPEIAKAFQTLYKQAPVKVHTVTMKARTYFRRGVLGFGTKGKKAYVYLPKGVTVDIL